MRRILIPFSLFTVSILAAAPVLAQKLLVPVGGVSTVDVGLPAYIEAIYTWGIGAAALLAVLMLVFGGVQYVLSAGSFVENEAGKERIKSAIYGIIILLCASLILALVNRKLTNLSLDSIPENALGEVTSQITKLQAQAMARQIAQHPDSTEDENGRARLRSNLEKLEQSLAKNDISQQEFSDALDGAARSINEYFQSRAFFEETKNGVTAYNQRIGLPVPTDREVFEVVRARKEDAYQNVISWLSNKEHRSIRNELELIRTETQTTKE